MIDDARDQLLHQADHLARRAGEILHVGAFDLPLAARAALVVRSLRHNTLAAERVLAAYPDDLDTVRIVSETRAMLVEAEATLRRLRGSD